MHGISISTLRNLHQVALPPHNNCISRALACRGCKFATGPMKDVARSHRKHDRRLRPVAASSSIMGECESVFVVCGVVLHNEKAPQEKCGSHHQRCVWKTQQAPWAMPSSGQVLCCCYQETGRTEVTQERRFCCVFLPCAL